MAITVLEECRDFRLGSVGSVLVIAWYSELTTAALDAIQKHEEPLADRHGKITLVSIILGATAAPPTEVRERMRKESPELDERRLGNLIVVRTQGLSAIIARSFLAAMSLMSSIKVPATLEAAATEVRALPGQDAETTNNDTLAADLFAFAELPWPTSPRG